MFLKSRSQYNTSGKLPSSTVRTSIRTASLARSYIAKFLLCVGNGLLLPSSLHSMRCLRSTGNGAPLTRTTGALFRSKDWAFGPFPCFSSCFPFCLFSCCLVKQDLARSLRSLALADSSNMPIPIYWRHNNIVYKRRLCCAQHTYPCIRVDAGRYRHARLCRLQRHVEILPSNIRLHTRGMAVMSVLTCCYGSWLGTMVHCVPMHRFDSCGVLYCLVKGDFKNPIFMIIVNIWPNGAIGYHGASS